MPTGRASKDPRRAALIGALGGMLLAICCVVIPPIVSPLKFMLEPSLVIIAVVGLSGLGALFGWMNGMEGR